MRVLIIDGGGAKKGKKHATRFLRKGEIWDNSMVSKEVQMRYRQRGYIVSQAKYDHHIEMQSLQVKEFGRVVKATEPTAPGIIKAADAASTAAVEASRPRA